LNLFEWLAEQRLEQAAREGAFDDLPGCGKPLDLEDDALVPAELRMAHRILKNAGFAPPEIEARREAANLRALIAAASDDDARRRAVTRLALLEASLDAKGGARVSDPRYFDKLIARFERPE
jgi:hypothetical protein